jgi:hypothetical protein
MAELDNFSAVPDQNPTSPNMDAASQDQDHEKKEKPQFSEAEKANVQKWATRIRLAKKHWSPVFERMKKCQQIAAYGAEKDWITSDRFTVPLLSRFINVAVAQLYAKNPQTEAEPRKRMRYTVWDGRQDSLKAAQELAAMGDPNAMAILNDVEQANSYQAMLARLGQTLSIVFDYFTAELSSGYKTQFKALVRRTKVNGVGYVKIGFQRAMGMNPEIVARIDDARDAIAKMKRLTEEFKEGDLGESDAGMFELTQLIETLSKEAPIILREGLVFDFPRSTQIIPDIDCVHLKTFAGCSWIVHEMDLSESRIQEIYGIEISGQFEPVKSDITENTLEEGRGPKKARVWEVQHKRDQQVFTIIDGYPGYVRKPGPPEVRIDRFWTIFALVFNEIEHDGEIYPPSDVWQARHVQFEYNRSRDALREHRIAARPQYMAPRGRLSDPDKERLKSGVAFELIELDALGPNDDIAKFLQRKPVVNIDPNMYEVGSLYDDMLRTVGVSRADLGQPSGDVTATASTISANANTANDQENVDDLDTQLGDLAHAGAQILLMNLSKETALEIAGPGAVWPESPMTAEAVQKDLLLTVKAGSSGKPNRGQQLANYERAMPVLLQIPGLNPIEAIAKPYLDLLDIDLEDALAEGVPSVVAMNAIAAKMAAGAGAGPGTPAGPAKGPSQAPGAPNGDGGAGGQQGNAMGGAVQAQGSSEGSGGPQAPFPLAPSGMMLS